MKVKDLFKKLIQKYSDLPVPVKASLWFVACSIVQKCMSLFTTPIFTRLMTTEQFGEFTLYFSWINVISIFTTLNLQYGSFNTARIKFGDDRETYTSSIQGLVSVLTVAAIAIFGIFGTVWEKLINLPTLILLVMVVNIWAQFAIGLWMSNCRFDYKYKPLIFLTLLMALLGQAIGLICVVNSENKGYARIFAVAAIDFVIGVGFFIYNLVRGKKLFVPKYWKFALGFNLPLIPYYLSQIVFSTSDRIMISSMVGVDKAGIYGLAHNIAFLLTFVVSAIRNAYIPRFFQKIKSNDGKTIKKNNFQLMLLLAVMLLMFVFIAPELLWIMGGETYYEAVWIIPPLVAGVLFEFFTDFSANILFYYEKKWMLVLSTIGCAVVNIVLNYFGMLVWGYFAAAYATLIAYILFWVFLDISARYVCRKNNLDPDAFLCSKKQLAIGAGFLALTAGCLLLYFNNFVRYGVIMLAVVVVAVLHKKVLAAIKSILSMEK